MGMVNARLLLERQPAQWISCILGGQWDRTYHDTKLVRPRKNRMKRKSCEDKTRARRKKGVVAWNPVQPGPVREVREVRASMGHKFARSDGRDKSTGVLDENPAAWRAVTASMCVNLQHPWLPKRD